MDSLAFAVSRGGIRWEEAKLQLAAYYSKRNFPDSAASEYAGLVRDQPLAEFPRRMLASALAQETEEGQGAIVRSGCCVRRSRSSRPARGLSRLGVS